MLVCFFVFHEIDVQELLHAVGVPLVDGKSLETKIKSYPREPQTSSKSLLDFLLAHTIVEKITERQFLKKSLE